MKRKKKRIPVKQRAAEAAIGRLSATYQLKKIIRQENKYIQDKRVTAYNMLETREQYSAKAKEIAADPYMQKALIAEAERKLKNLRKLKTPSGAPIETEALYQLRLHLDVKGNKIKAEPTSIHDIQSLLRFIQAETSSARGVAQAAINRGIGFKRTIKKHIEDSRNYSADEKKMMNAVLEAMTPQELANFANTYQGTMQAAYDSHQRVLTVGGDLISRIEGIYQEASANAIALLPRTADHAARVAAGKAARAALTPRDIIDALQAELPQTKAAIEAAMTAHAGEHLAATEAIKAIRKERGF